jgi:hypothetical protein
LEPKGREWEGGEEVLRISKIIFEVSSYIYSRTKQQIIVDKSTVAIANEE